MKDYIYYTPKELALKIMELIEDRPYKNVIDICCGSWNLLHAAQEKLKCQFITGVDVDSSVKRYKKPSDKVFVEDGREYALRIYKKKKYDLVLSNPPFGLLVDNDRIMKTKLLNHKYAPMLTKRFESEMLVANMLLMKKEGVLVVILPQTFVFGVSNLNIRKEIAKEFHIDAIIKLPEGTFKKNDIRTCVVIMQKAKRQKSTTYYVATYDNKWNIKQYGEINYETIAMGNWNFDSNNMKINSNYKIFRGVICSSKFEEGGKNKIFHCSSVIQNNRWKPLEMETNEMLGNKVTEAGDVLVNRIGKKAGYWCICNKTGYSISDCVIVIKSLSVKDIEWLNINSIKGRLNIPVRGVATQYITENDIRLLLELRIKRHI